MRGPMNVVMRGIITGLAGVGLAACALSGPPPPVRPEPFATTPAPRLPPIDSVDGPLRLDIVYPPDSAVIVTRDSTFVFGSTGSGRAGLRINGAGVPVAPDGAFLAFLPVPPDGLYRVEATKGAERASLDHVVVVPPPPSVPDTGAAILRETIEPRGAIALPSGEPVDVRFLGTAGGQAAIHLPDGAVYELTERPLVAGATVDAANFQRMPAGRESGPRGVSAYVGTVPAGDWVSADTMDREPALGGIGPGFPFALGFSIGQDTVSLRIASEAGFDVPLRAQQDSVDALLADAQHSLQALLEFARLHPSFVAVRAPLLSLAVDGDTAWAPLSVNLRTLQGALFDDAGTVAVVRAPSNPPSDWTIRARPGRGGPFHWFWQDGTRLALDGEWNGQLRVRLAPGLAAWVPAADVELLAKGAPAARATVSAVRLIPAEGWVDARIALDARLPNRVDVDGRRLRVTVYGATSAVNFMQYGALDPLVHAAAWSQPADGVFVLDIELTQAVWGYRVFFDDAGALVVRVRRPPVIDPEHPLAGLLVAVDAGHPPGGAIGPTRLTEAEANLAVAFQLKPLLEAAGARVLMLRTDAAPVDLGARPRMAAEFDADLLVSLHNNAFPDGVNPFENNGTSVYYYQPQSLDLARAVDRELVAELGLRDLGIGRADLALVRPSWMPAVLSETMFLMVPAQENALRDPAVQRRIAAAHVRALEAFLAERALAARDGG